MTKKTKLSLLMSTMLVVGIATSGCGGDTKADKKVVHIGGTVAVVNQLDPAKDWDGWYTVRYGVGETLFKIDKDGNATPWLAQKVENINPTTWKITINEKATFSNGEKVTAEKVAASLKRTAEMNKRAVSLQGAEYKAEGNVLTITTKKPYADFINDLCDPYATILDVAGTKDFANAPIGSGPFVMKSLDPGKKAVMVKNAKYWGGEVKTESVEYTKVEDQNTLTMALKSGEIDIAQDLNAESAVALAKEDKISITKLTQPRVYQVYFNLEKLTDKAVREAIMYGMDKKSIGENHLKGGMVEAYSAFPDNTDYSAKNLNPHRFDVEKAKAILAAAGYSDSNGDGILDKDGTPLTVKLSVYKRASIPSIGTEIQGQLKKIGINVEIVQNEKSNFYAPGNYEMGLYYVVTAPTGDPASFLRDAYGVDGNAHFNRYTGDAVQSYLADLNTTFDHAGRVALVNKIQQQVIDDAAGDYVGFNILHVGMKKGVTGYEVSANDYYQVTKDLAIK